MKEIKCGTTIVGHQHRIVIPLVARKICEIEEGDELEFILGKDSVLRIEKIKENSL